MIDAQRTGDHAGMTGAGLIALTGDLPATIAAIKHSSPVLLYPIKAAVAFPLVYHYLGGLRHVIWDKASYGNQVHASYVASCTGIVRAARVAAQACLSSLH